MRKPSLLIDDLETELDELGGAHLSVAKAIYQQIKDMEGGKAIALEGGWGSGKSSVIKKIKRLVEKEDKIEIVVFDAWGHQGDPLRRSFLEHLIIYFLDKQLLDDKKWMDRKERLSRVIEEKKETKTPSTTWAGGLLVLSGLLIPLATSNIIKPHWLQLVVTLLPFVFALLSASVITFTKWRKNKGKEKSKKTPNNLLENLSLIKESSISTISSTSRSLNPTSVEFLNTFKHLMDDVFEKGIKNSEIEKLVLVIDNLDRVSSDDALELWSTMRIFLEECRKDNLWSKKLWVIVPYDFASIAKLWDNKDKNETAISFINKSFQIRYEVPPPVLTNWKKYFFDKLQEAFQDEISNEQKEILFKIYNFVNEERFNRSKERKIISPTPREIKLCINDLGALYRVVETIGLEIPIAYQFAYVMITKTFQGKDIPTMIICGDEDKVKIPSQSLKTLLGASLTLSLAALWYKQPKDIAQQLLLKEPILRSLKNNESDSFRNLMAVDGFLDQLTLILKDPNLFTNLTELTNATLCLYENNLVVSEENDLYLFLKCLRLNLENLEIINYTHLSKEVGKGLNILIGTEITLIKTVVSNLCNKDILKDIHQSYQNWVDCIKETLRGKESILNNNNTVILIQPLDENHLMNIMSAFDESDTLLQFVKIEGIDEDLVIKFLTARINTFSFEAVNLQSLKNLNKTKFKFNYTEIIESIKQAIEKSETEARSGTPSFYNYLFYIILDLINYENKNYTQSLKKFANTGSFLDFCYNFHDVDNRVFSFAIHLILLERSQPTSFVRNASSGLQQIEAQINDPENNKEFCDKLIKVLENNNSLNKIWSSKENTPISWPFYIYALKKLVNSDKLEELIDFQRLIDNWQYINTDTFGKENFAKLIQYLDMNESLNIQIPDVLFNNKEIAEKFLYLLEHLEKNKECLAHSISDLLDKKNDDEIAELLIVNEINIKLINTINDKLNEPKIRNVLVLLAKYCFTKQTINPYPELKLFVRRFVDNNEIKIRIINIFKDFVKFQFSESFYELFGDYIYESENYGFQREIDLEQNIFDPIIERANIIELEWLFNFIKRNNKKHLSEQTTQKLLELYQKQESTDLKKLLKEIVDWFQINDVQTSN